MALSAVRAREQIVRNKVNSEEILKDTLLARGCVLNEACSNSIGHSLWQDYLEFLYTVANGTSNRDSDGWKFWRLNDFKPLDEALSNFGKLSLSVELLPECYVVFGDFKEGEKFLCVRRLRPTLDYSVVHMVHGDQIQPYAADFDEFVRNYEIKKDYEASA